MTLHDFKKLTQADRREWLESPDATRDEKNRVVAEAEGRCVNNQWFPYAYNVDINHTICDKCGEGFWHLTMINNRPRGSHKIPDYHDAGHAMSILKKLVLGAGTTIELYELLNTGLEHIGFQVQVNRRNENVYNTEYYDADTLESAIVDAYLMGLKGV